MNTETQILKGEKLIETAKQAFIFAPSWAKQSDRAAVVKYKDVEEFKSKQSGKIVEF